MAAGGFVSVKWVNAFLQQLFNYIFSCRTWQEELWLKQLDPCFSLAPPPAHFCLLMPSVIILQNKWRRFITSDIQSFTSLCPEYIHNLINRKKKLSFIHSGQVFSSALLILQYEDVNILAVTFRGFQARKGFSRYMYYFTFTSFSL